MRKVILSAICLIGLISMSFTKSNSNKIIEIKKSTVLDFNKDFDHEGLSNLKGAKKVLVTGTSATAFPGTLTDSFSSLTDDSKELNLKFNKVIAKY